MQKLISVAGHPIVMDSCPLQSKTVLRIPTCNHLVTKKKVLQAIFKIFDPQGFVSPVVIHAKIFLQALWQHKVRWDELLNDDLAKDWLDI